MVWDPSNSGREYDYSTSVIQKRVRVVYCLEQELSTESQWITYIYRPIVVVSKVKKQQR